ncbi:Arm DNA-binding domain-containing protein [Lysinibacillus xylanilyticus]|uniref:Arm DNA-binding domain-containing protein n=1 Tax=Lysinibacillus xylanilyticus TaxID=582475 RepID=UPI003D069759
MSTLCSKNYLAVILASVSIKKKFAYRYRLYDHNGMRKEKKKQNFNTSLEAERALTVLIATIECWRKNCS